MEAAGLDGAGSPGTDCAVESLLAADGAAEVSALTASDPLAELLDESAVAAPALPEPTSEPWGCPASCDPLRAGEVLAESVEPPLDDERGVASAVGPW